MINVYMNFSSSTAAVKGTAYFGAGTGQIWMDDLHCDGTELSLDTCHFRPWGTNNCGHNEDLSVICTGKRGYCKKAHFGEGGGYLQTYIYNLEFISTGF